MSHTDDDREDLIRDATALRNRIEVQVPQATPIVLGVRADGALSIYWGVDPVWHFDAENRLRRCYLDGLLYRTQGTTLAKLDRVRGESQTVLQRADLSEQELATVFTNLQTYLSRLVSATENETLTVLREVTHGETGSVWELILPRLQSLCETPIQLAPAIKGKK